MKTIKYTISLVGILLMAVSCTLEREDYNEIYTDNFFKSENDFKLAVTSLYHSFNTNWNSNDEGVFCSNNQGYQIFTEMTTDALWCTWGWEWDDLHLHTWYASKTGNDMNIFYKAFARYNFLSSSRNVVRNIEASSVNEEVKKKYIAEAKALRGWMAVYLYDLFGTVPVAPDEVLDNPEEFVYLARLSEADYTAMVESDLTYAIDNLPSTSTERGRLTKGAARMLLLKFYMIQKDFTKALPIARDLYNMEGEGIYTLLTEYESVFAKENLGNRELILVIPCNLTNMPNYWISMIHSKPLMNVFLVSSLHIRLPTEPVSAGERES
jgi:hypothetical protein